MHEVLLHIIDGPGTGLTFMILGFFALIFGLAAIRLARASDYMRGKEAARREGLENIQVTLARLVSDAERNKQGAYIENG